MADREPAEILEEYLRPTPATHAAMAAWEASRKRTMPTQIALRLDGELYEALKKDAAANGRTVAQSARFLLRKGLDASQ